MPNTVLRRCVFYVAGFDPSGPAQHHRLYTQEAAKQSALCGYSIDVGSRKNSDAHFAQWSVEHSKSDSSSNSTCNTQTDYVFARWDDIVRAHWGKLDNLINVLQFALNFFATQWFYLRTGGLWAMLRLAWPPVVALVSPLVLLLCSMAVWLSAIWIAWAFSAWPSWGALAWTNLLGALTGLGLWLAVGRLEAKFHMLWLMRSYMFTRQYATGHVVAVDDRLHIFATAIAQARSSGRYDEVLVVGHSSGCILAASAAARSLSLTTVVQDSSTASPPSPLGLLTLGQCIPLLSSLPMAQRFKADLMSISQSSALRWVDFTAPTDGSCFAFVDAITAAWPAQKTTSSHPTLLSPRFQTLMSPAQYHALRKNRFDLHFQYIHSGSLAGDYDYYAITSGSQSLNERFASAQSVTDFKKFKIFG